MKLRPTLYRADWVLPGATPPIKGGEVLVGDDGRILGVGSQGSRSVPPESDVVDLGEAALLPGLVNLHAHPELTLLRGALDELAFPDWIARLVEVRGRGGGRPDDADAARWGVVEALRAGITTMAATEASGAALTALREAGMRGVVYREVFGPDPDQANTAMADLQSAIARLRAAETERVRVGISPHAPYSVSDALFTAAAEYARAEGLPLAVHVAESVDEEMLVGQGGGVFGERLRARGIATPARARSPIELLERLGVLRARPLLIHCTQADAEDIRIIAAAGCAVAHCPTANAKLGHGVIPYPALREAGVVVGLGTDSVASNNRMDLLEEARCAALLQRAAQRSAEPLPPPELLELCTLAGARALGLDHRIGTLEVGKDADLCAVSFAGPHVRPVHDPVAALFHSARGSDVVLTAVAGRICYRDGQILTVHEKVLRSRIDAAAERLRTELRMNSPSAASP